MSCAPSSGEAGYAAGPPAVSLSSASRHAAWFHARSGERLRALLKEHLGEEDDR